MTPRTRAGLVKFRPVRPGARVALVAPASPFDRAAFDAGVAELMRLGFDVVYDDTIFERESMVAGPAGLRAEALLAAWGRDDVDAVLAVRGGYGSVELLPSLPIARLLDRRIPLIGYSDITSLHSYLNCQAGCASVHGAMIDGRLSRGSDAYDRASLLGSLSDTPLGELIPAGLDVIRPGEAAGALFGGTLTQLVASLGTPYAFDPPPGYVLLLDEVSERPYRLQRMLVKLALAGRLERAAAVVCGQLPRCDESDGRLTGRTVVAEFFTGFSGPVIFGFPTGHTVTPLVSVPLGVEVRVIADGRPRVVFDEAAAE
jgi:muramoyltetrapeptide carboxypeptidase